MTTKEIRSIIKDRCRAWRIQNRYTMRAVADAAGVTRQAVSCFELYSGCSARIIRGYIKLGMPADILLLYVEGSKDVNG